MFKKFIFSGVISAILASLCGSSTAAPFEYLGSGQPPYSKNISQAVANPPPLAQTSVSTGQQPSFGPPESRAHLMQSFDYGSNINSDVFGANLFTGAFAGGGPTQFNPDYLISIGDNIQVRLWGAFEYDQVVTVDPKGNIFLPHAGPVQVMGMRNIELQKSVDSAIGKTFKNNVFSYASLASAQPVRVFVSGFVNRPGLYSGTSMDSLLHYLDKAGGIDPERGSFLSVQVKRGATVRSIVSLYDFLLSGIMPMVQFSDGDMIFVSARQNTVKVSGLAENTKRFEFPDETRSVSDVARVAKPLAAATHVRVVRNTGAIKNTEYFPLADASRVPLQNGDELQFTADKKPGTITVRVEGEHQSSQEYILPYGSRMGSLLKNIQYSERSDKENLQLFRLSVKDRQKQMLTTALKSLETAALTARSGTSDEARLRKDESELILQWVDRAKKIEPSGQVVIAESESKGDLLLENGDVLRVPTLDGLVLVGGEVLFPNAVAFDRRLSVDDYVQRAGGYTQNADSARIVVARRDGSFAEVNVDKGFFSLGIDRVALRSGDEILVLPKIDVKSRQIWKDMSQIIYQIAISARVVIGL